MQYIPDGAISGLQITNQAARGISSTIDEIARRRRQKSAQMFLQGQVLGNDQMMADAANMNSSKEVAPRTFIDSLGNSYAGTYDQVRMQAYQNYRKEMEGKSYLEKIRLGREYNSFLVDPNRVYDRRRGVADDIFGYGSGGGGGGTSSYVPYASKIRNIKTGEEADIEYTGPKGTQYTDSGHKSRHDAMADSKFGKGNWEVVQAGRPASASVDEKSADKYETAVGNQMLNSIAQADLDKWHEDHEDMPGPRDMLMFNKKYRSRGLSVYRRNGKLEIGPYDEKYYRDLMYSKGSLVPYGEGVSNAAVNEDDEADQYLKRKKAK